MRRPVSGSGAGRPRPRSAAIWSHSSSIDRAAKRSWRCDTPIAPYSLSFSTMRSGDPVRVYCGSSQSASPRWSISVIMPMSIGAPGRTRSRCGLEVRDRLRHQLLRRALRDPTVATLGDPAQRGLRRSADPDRRSRLLRRDAGRRPTSPTYSSVHASRMPSIASLVMRPRSANGIPSAANSPSTCPAPTPRITRPPDRRVEGAERLGGLERVPVRGHEDVGHEPDVRGLAREPAERRDRVVPRGRHRLGLLARDRDVVADRPRRRTRRRPRSRAAASSSATAPRRAPTACDVSSRAPAPAAGSRRRARRRGRQVRQGTSCADACSRWALPLALAGRRVDRIGVERRDDVAPERSRCDSCAISTGSVLSSMPKIELVGARVTPALHRPGDVVGRADAAAARRRPTPRARRRWARARVKLARSMSTGSGIESSQRTTSDW